jgi:hypothetical protein
VLNGDPTAGSSGYNWRSLSAVCWRTAGSTSGGEKFEMIEARISAVLKLVVGVKIVPMSGSSALHTQPLIKKISHPRQGWCLQ